MTSLAERARHLLNTNFYSEPNLPERVKKLRLDPPALGQYVLRCPILIPGKQMNIPDDLAWCENLVDESLRYQNDSVGVDQPFAYLTVRHGLVESRTDDEFHVDGFSTKVPHIPEQNYIWTDTCPTEYVAAALPVPHDFDPRRHNIQHFIQDSLPNDTRIEQLDAETVYAMDPYVPHRRPRVSQGTRRTFVRLSMTPIPIDDRNNHVNPAFGPITSEYDGVADFRDKLERYPVVR